MNDTTSTGPETRGSLMGRTVLVTGGNGGIGLGMASACGRAGARLVLWGRDETKNAARHEPCSPWHPNPQVVGTR